MGLRDHFDKLPADFIKKYQVLHCIDRPLDELTVGDLCKKAGISEATFYRYFSTKDQIRSWYAEVCEHIFLENVGRTLSWSTALRKHFELLEEERDLYQYFDSSQAYSAILGFESRRVDVLVETLERFRGVKVDAQLLLEVRIYVSVETWVAQNWFSRKIELTPQEIASLLEDSVPRRLYYALNIQDEEGV